MTVGQGPGKPAREISKPVGPRGGVGRSRRQVRNWIDSGAIGRDLAGGGLPAAIRDDILILWMLIFIEQL
jgi:hypothetical protein